MENEQLIPMLPEVKVNLVMRADGDHPHQGNWYERSVAAAGLRGARY